jgi:hypothetical protein
MWLAGKLPEYSAPRPMGHVFFYSFAGIKEVDNMTITE